MRVKPNPLKWKIKYWFMEFKLGASNIFRKNSFIMIGTIALIVLILFAAISIFYHNFGRFSVKVEKNAGEKGLYLSTEKNARPGSMRTRLFGNVIEECDNINIEELPQDLNNEKFSGEHSGDNFMAYTFYITNGGEEKVDYRFKVDINHLNKEVHNAIWLFLYCDKDLTIYAKKRPDGTPERQYSFNGYSIAKDLGKNSKFIKRITEKDKSYFTQEDKDALGIMNENGLYELSTKPFAADRRMVSEVIKDFRPGQTKRYTMVAWLEGEDPQCKDDIKGGSIGFQLSYELVEK